MTDSPVSKLPLTVKEAMEGWFANNASMGEGDLRTQVTLEALQRTETADSWTINGKRLGRAEMMELMLDMVAAGYSIPAILACDNGMPKPRTVMGWLEDFKPFRDLMEVAEKMRAIILSEQAVEIMDDCDDPKMIFRDKARAELRMRMAEVYHSKKFNSKHQQIDVTHHLDDLSGDEVWSRFRSVLVTHKKMIEEKTGVVIDVPIIETHIERAEVEEEAEQDIQTLGMQGFDDIPEE